MCAIVGAIIEARSNADITAANLLLNHIFKKSLERGRDGRGWCVTGRTKYGLSRTTHKVASRNEIWGGRIDFFEEGMTTANLVANLRAEPTTEFVENKVEADQQPYQAGKWAIAHNGTIANDHDLRSGVVPTNIDSAAIVERLYHHSNRGRQPQQAFAMMEREIKGSYAILASNLEQPGTLYAAANYRPIWYMKTSYGTFFASASNYFPDWAYTRMVDPYTVVSFCVNGPQEYIKLQEWEDRPNKHRALVVCSGGLDSVVAAKSAIFNGYEIELLHFQYGSRAEGPEVAAVKAVAEALDVPLRLFPLPIYRPEDSPLLRADSAIAGGEEGAEFAHEWVPARNLAMLAVATALAEAGGFETIVLGNNLEEAGAYPDNEPEFIARFNDVLPFAVADGKRVRVVMPVGNLMKHEIVAMGHQFGAPLDKTWSCYRAGEQHCGTCGPCFMRRTAFKINGLPEVITYACEEA